MPSDVLSNSFMTSKSITKEEIFFFYFLIINLVGAALVLVDKKKARARQWRIPKSNFFIFSFFGAGVGEFITMLVIHHKTRHLSFMVFIPVITIIFYTILFVLMHG